MGTLYENIRDLCEKNGIRPAKMCTEAGVSKGLITDLKMGRRTGVSAKTAQKIATYFGVSVGYLLGESEEKEKLPTNSEEGKIIETIVEREKLQLLVRSTRDLSDADIDKLLKIVELMKD